MAITDDVAVVGMACRFPGASSVEEFWENLVTGAESITSLSSERLAAAGVEAAVTNDPRYVARAGVLDQVDLFDAEYFGYSPREAELIDPQQRLFLECAVQVLQRTGHDPAQFDGLIGVYGSVGFSDYLQRNIAPARALLSDFSDLQLLVSTDKDYLVTRAAYKLDLRGPALTVQTACSSSLVAVHLAVQSLLNGECDLALAGGVSLLPRDHGYLYTPGGVLSHDGHCRAFDAEADGTVPGSGVGLVALRRLSDALADGDHIHAVVIGSAIGNDGSNKVGYTAPAARGQARVISEAQQVAQVAAGEIGYVEAHGAATALGDPIEVAALSTVFGHSERPWCGMGSVKTNIGHLDAAAGIAGFIKSVLAVEQGEIPPSLFHDEPNPDIDFARSAFYVPQERQPWRTSSRRVAGVSSFGIGGTNAHILVAQAPETPMSAAASGSELVPLSGRSPAALEQAAADLARYLDDHPSVPLADIAHTLRTGRPAHRHRQVIVASGTNEAARLLRGGDNSRLFAARTPRTAHSLVYLISGIGDQYPGMIAELYARQPDVRDDVDRCAELLIPQLGEDIRPYLVVADPSESSPTDPFARMVSGSRTSRFTRTRLAQPALFVTGYAVARHFQQLGLAPTAMLGYSVGEYVAACLAGVFSLEDALGLVARRANLIDALPPGALLAVMLSAEEIEPYLRDGVHLSACDGPLLTVVGGTEDAIDTLADRLRAEGTASRRLAASHAYHTPLVAAAGDQLEEFLRTVEFAPPITPFLSNVTGRWITEQEAMSPAYWGRQLREPVQFAKALQAMWELPSPAVLEIGPGRALGALAVQHPARAEAVEPIVLGSLPAEFDRVSSDESVTTAAGRLWAAGLPVTFSRMRAPGARRRPLPTYPFERRRYWIDPPPPGSAVQIEAGRRRDVGDWFYLPSWQKQWLRAAANPATGTWLVFADAEAVGLDVADQLRAKGQDVTVVRDGPDSAASGDDFVVDVTRKADVVRLFRELKAMDKVPDRIVHTSGVRPADDAETPRAFHTLLSTAQALFEVQIVKQVQLCLVTANGQMIAGEAELSPEAAMLPVAAQVVAQELPNVSARVIDVDRRQLGERTRRDAVAEIVAELVSSSAEPLVALRDSGRWRQTFEPTYLPEAPDRWLRDKGVYVVIGGLGTVGEVVAGHLTDRCAARLVLVQRTEFPPRAEWDSYLAGASADERVARDIVGIRQLEARGAEVLVVAADVAVREELAAALDMAVREFGPINGVVHSAGTVGAGAALALADADPGSCAAHFRSKVQGLPVLIDVLENHAVDFVLLNSSISSVLGGIGYMVYAAANACMDAHAAWQNAHSRVRWTSVNWEGFVYGADDPEQAGATLKDLLINSSDAEQVMGRLFGSNLPAQVVNSTGDLARRIDQWVRGGRAAEDIESGPPRIGGATHPRPSLQVVFEAPRTDLERSLAALWESLLGVDGIGIHDNFFELGGHSLIATRVVARIATDFEVQVPLHLLLTEPTLAQLAAAVESATARAHSAPAPIQRINRGDFRREGSA